MSLHRAVVRTLRAAANVIEVDGALRAMRIAPDDPIQAYEFISAFNYGEVRINPFQIREEILALLEFLGDETPRRIIEIGTAQGGTLFLLTRVAAIDAVLVSVDIPGGSFGGGYRRTNGRLYKSFARAAQTIHLIRSDSHTEETKVAVAEALGGLADFLFIDGDHTYEGVRNDFTLYEPLVRDGGTIALHDIVEGPPHVVGGVPRFWKEIRHDYETREFVRDPMQGGFGMGIIKKRTSEAT
jgi:predicted O-methyltransferase YrrM